MSRAVHLLYLFRYQIRGGIAVKSVPGYIKVYTNEIYSLLYCTVQYCTTVLYCTVLYCTVQYCTVYSTVLVLYIHTVLYNTVYTVQYCTVNLLWYSKY